MQTVQADGDKKSQADLDRLVELVERGGIDDARELASQLVVRWPDSAPIQHMARVLEPPRVIARGGPPARDRSEERQWLKERARSYPGCWLAVLGERLLAAETRFGEALDKARSVPGGEEAILFYSRRG